MPEFAGPLHFPTGNNQTDAGMIGSNNLSELTDRLAARGSLWMYTSSSFPPTPSAGMRVVRTDYNYMEFVYTGSLWLSLSDVVMETAYYPGGPGAIDLVPGNYEHSFVSLPSHLAFRMLRMSITWYNFGTNNGSNYWTFALRTFDGLTNLQTTPANTSGGSGGTWTRTEATTWNTQPATSDKGLQLQVYSTGTPGNLRCSTATLIGRWTL